MSPKFVPRLTAVPAILFVLALAVESRMPLSAEEAAQRGWFGRGRRDIMSSSGLPIENIPQKGEFIFQPMILSFQYNAENWSLTTEYEYQRKELKDSPVSSYNGRVNGESVYVQYLYRLSSRWQWLLRYDYAVSDRNDRDGERFEASGKGQDYSRFAKDVTAGVHWRVTPSWNIQAEVHHVDGTAWLPRQDNDDDNTEQHWNMLLLQTSFSF